MADNDKTIGGRRGRGDNRSNEDVHSTGRAARPGRGSDSVADVHGTGRAVRPDRSADEHSTAKGARGQRPAADEHSTAKGSRGQAANPRPFEQKNNLAGNLAADASADGAAEWPDFFELDGVKYKNEGVLSSSSGEAIVFTVSRNDKKYALKIYYYDPEHRPNHKVLEKIKQLGASGLLVGIVSHGQWQNPARSGELNDYELMDFCEGGSLDGVLLQGDEKALAEVAVRMAAAIDFLAKHGILHRDIKPANFFYADKERTRIVLADFGISMECPEGGFIKIDEMRSPVYAAPEFYTNVPGEPAEVGVESDYFSLGVALLCLWMGKAQLTANESQLLRSKLNETLPMPKDLSPHMASLIKALTRLKMSDRATMDDIKRWAKGETLGSEGGDADATFKVVFNSSKNQVAHSPAQLAQYLVQDKEVGAKCVYSGRVTRWLEETGYTPLAVTVEDIVEKVYPSNQNAGLLAVAYLLDPAMDYEAPDGTHHTDPAEIALYSHNNCETMAPELLEPDTALKIYFRALKLDKSLASLDRMLAMDDFDDSETLRNYLATYYFALLFNDLPFPIFGQEEMKHVDTVDEVLAVFREAGDISRGNKLLLRSEAFVQWLAYRDPALAGKVRMLHDSDSDDVESIYYNSSSAYRIAFELNPLCDYDFSIDPNDKDRIYSIQEVGRYLNDKLSDFAQGYGSEEDFMALFAEMDNTPLGSYLRARGEQYKTFLDWNRFCMDVDNDDNEQKSGPYDAVIGAYKSTAGFLQGFPSYMLGEKEITRPDQLKKLPRKEVAEALGGQDREMPDDDNVPVAWLDAWLAVFYQENPQLDLSAQFTYEKETAKYIEFIEELDPANYYAERYRRAISRIDKAEKKLDRSESRVKLKRNFFLVAAGLPTLCVLGGSWLFDAPGVNPITGHFWSTFLVCAACCLVAFWAFGSFFGALLPAAIGGLVCAAIAWAGFAWFPSVLYVVAGLLLLGVAIYSLANLFKRKNVNDGINIDTGSFQFRQLDALYFTFKQDDDDLDSAVADLATLQSAEDETTREDIGFFGCMWAALAWMMFIIWFNATPQLSGEHSWAGERQAVEELRGRWALGSWTVKYASGSTKIVCNVDSVAPDGKSIFGTMVIAGQAPVAAKGTVSSDRDTVPETFQFWPDGSTPLKQCVEGRYSTREKKMEGHYYDRKGIMHQVYFTATPLGTAQAETPAPESTGRKSSGGNRSEKATQSSPAESQPAESGGILPSLPGWEDTPEAPAPAEEAAPAPEPATEQSTPAEQRRERPALKTPGR